MNNDSYWSDRDLERTDPALVQVVEEMEDMASGDLASLKIRELESGTLYIIHEYDGLEEVMTVSDFQWLRA